MVVRKIKWRPLKVRTNSRSYERGKFKKYVVTAYGKNYECVYEIVGGGSYYTISVSWFMKN